MSVFDPAPTRVCSRCQQTKAQSDFEKNGRIYKGCRHCRRLGAARISRFRLRHPAPAAPSKRPGDAVYVETAAHMMVTDRTGSYPA